MFASDDARIEHGEKNSGQRAEREVHGGVIHSQAAARERGAEQIYLGDGDEVTGVDEVYQGANLKLVPALYGSCVSWGGGILRVSQLGLKWGNRHELPAQDKSEHHGQPSITAKVLTAIALRFLGHSFV